MRIDDVEVGKRLRSKRDVAELAKSITQIGLLNPITVTEDGRLVAGLHRLEACKSLGWTDIPANVVSLGEIQAQLAEIDENLIRNDLNELEKAQHLKRRKELYEAAHPETRPVTERGGPGRGHKNESQNATSFVDDTAEKTNTHRATVSRSVARAEKIAPDVQELIADSEVADSGVELDALARLAPEDQRRVAREVVAKRRGVREVIREKNREERTADILADSQAGNGPQSTTRYPVLLADPPWRYEHAVSSSREIENQYPTMTLDEIKALDVAGLTTEAAVLYLWVTSPKLEEGLDVMRAWGFTYRSCLVWVKDRVGMGYWARQRHELLLVGTKGGMPAPPPELRPDSVIEAPRGEHSAKPVEAYELIERQWPTLPKLELFARSPREGWDCWGHEA